MCIILKSNDGCECEPLGSVSTHSASTFTQLAPAKLSKNESSYSKVDGYPSQGAETAGIAIIGELISLHLTLYNVSKISFETLCFPI